MESQIKQKILFGVFIFIAFVYVIRLLTLQIFDESYIRSAQNNVFARANHITPPAVCLWIEIMICWYNNDNIYDLFVTPEQVKNLDTNAFLRSNRHYQTRVY